MEWIYTPHLCHGRRGAECGRGGRWQQMPPDLIPLLAKNKDVKIENTDPLGSIGVAF